MSTLIESNNIKVFPATHRSDRYDRAARLTTEKNLTSIINRLTDIDSFIISGLTVNSSGTTLSSGTCNIGGYYVEILSDVTLTIGSSSKYIYLRLLIGDSTTDYSYLVGDDAEDPDPEHANRYVYNGVQVIDSDQPKSDNPSEKYLLVAKSENGSWVSIPNNNLKFTANSIRIKETGTDLTGLKASTADRYSNNLYDFIKDLIIDDGDV